MRAVSCTVCGHLQEPIVILVVEADLTIAGLHHREALRIPVVGQLMYIPLWAHATDAHEAVVIVTVQCDLPVPGVHKLAGNGY